MWSTVSRRSRLVAVDDVIMIAAKKSPEKTLWAILNELEHISLERKSFSAFIGFSTAVKKRNQQLFCSRPTCTFKYFDFQPNRFIQGLNNDNFINLNRQQSQVMLLREPELESNVTRNDSEFADLPNWIQGQNPSGCLKTLQHFSSTDLGVLT